MKEYLKTVIDKNKKLSDAIEILHKGGMRISLVVDKKGLLIGTITDGDIRRALINKVDLDSPVKNIMNSNPITALESLGSSKIESLMDSNDIMHMPIIDSEGLLVGLETKYKIYRSKVENPVLLMAGGFGKRLSPLTDSLPKPLLKVGKKPILETIINRFKEYGFYKFYISTHYRSEMIKDYFEDGSKWQIEIKYLDEDKPMGTGGSLQLLPDINEEFPLILMNGDLLTQVNFESLLYHHNKSQSNITVCVVEYDFQVPYGVLQVNKTKVKQIVEKPIHKFFVNAGIYVINSNLINQVRGSGHLDMPDLVTSEIDSPNGVNMFPLHEEWIDIGRLSDLNKAKSLIND
tara:strand:- start:22 stop:1062 length:1041 start_codon:yes stop_codon:yes gene_type:complete